MTVMPTHETVLEAIRSGVRKVKGTSLTDEDISDTTRLWPGVNPDELSLGFDSLDLLELVVALEEEFGWAVPEEKIDAEDLQTVGDLVALAIAALRDDQ